MGSRGKAATGLRAGLLGLLLCVVAPVARAGCAPDGVELKTPQGATMRFSVEIADSPEERARGLMFRDHLPRSSGMLFLFDRPEVASFWMKNTRIPLDMIFSGPDGRVKTVHANAVPGDLTPIPGGDGILSVLEINGGLAGRLGIVPGSLLRYPSIDRSLAAWPCD